MLENMSLIVLNIILAACIIIAPIAIVSTVYYLYRMAFERRPEAPFRLLTLNPGNLVFYPSDLTASGKLYRKRLLLSFAIFIGDLAIAMTAGFTIEGITRQ